MNKLFLGLLAGVALGVGGMWFASHRPSFSSAPAAAAPSKDEGKPESASTGPTLTKEQQSSSGLKLAHPEMTSLPREASGFGRVLDAAPFVAAVSEVATAQAALDASEKELTRVRTLHADGANASAQAVETAEAAAQRDRVQLLGARSRLLAGWGRALTTRADLALLEDSLQKGWALVRIDVPVGTEAADATAVRVGALTDDSALTPIELLGPAPSTDAQFQGPGYLAVWHEKPLPPGTALRAIVTLPGEPLKLLTLPGSAFVRHEGGLWVYVQTDTGSFERRHIESARTLADGYAIAGGVTINDNVVITGAQQLLSAEVAAISGPED